MYTRHVVNRKHNIYTRQIESERQYLNARRGIYGKHIENAGWKNARHEANRKQIKVTRYL